jgi:hypothetical protein
MTISVVSTAGVGALNNVNLNQLAEALRAMGFGSFVRSMPTALNGRVPLAAAVNPYVAAAAIALTLPDDAKAAFLFRGYGRVGTAAPIELVVDAAQTGAAANPAANHVGISPSGDLVLHGADAWTLVDLLYLPAKYDVQELSLPIAASAITLPSSGKFLKPVLLLEAEITASSIPGGIGKKIVDGAGTAPAAGHAALDTAKLLVEFNAADTLTGTARVKWGTYNVLDLDTFLETAQNFI